MSLDPTLEFLQNLPQIKPGEEFWFACHPEVPCFNACCSDLNMPLTPYDVLRLSQGLNLGSEAFIEEFGIVSHYQDTGFPVMYLRMDDSTPDRLCPFVTASGCGVYKHRSSACRTYPLGRATKPFQPKNATSAASAEFLVEEQYFLVREDHCKGFAEAQKWTYDTWLGDQGLLRYNQMNDRYMQLMARYKAVAGKALLSGKHATMALLSLYQQDRFLEFIQSMNLLSRLHFTGDWSHDTQEERQKAILQNPEERLLFGFEWMELILFSSAPRIAPCAT